MGGDWERGRLGEGETGRQGDWETRRLGDKETGRQGDWETGRSLTHYATADKRWWLEVIVAG
jgi:hypothetical protein